jgi:hypothetical protein
MDWCWKNQDEEKCREEGKNGKFNTHCAGETLKVVTLKKKVRYIDIWPFPGTEIYEASRRLGNKTPQLCMFTDCQLLSTRDERQQQAACQMENNAHVGPVAKFDTETQEDKGPFNQMGVVK